MDDAWVVLTCRDGVAEYWAWCRPRRDSPGFDEIFYTQRDGITAFSPDGDQLPQLMGHVFTLMFPSEGVASTGARFPERVDLRSNAEWRPAPPTLAVETDAGSPG